VALYGGELWWKGPRGRTYEGLPGITSGHESALNNFDALVCRAGRLAFPFHRRAPNAAVHREMQLPPARLLLEGRRLKWSLRLKLVDDHHPLATRKENKQGRPTTRDTKSSLALLNDLLPVVPFSVDTAARRTALQKAPPPPLSVPTKSLAARLHKAETMTNNKALLVYTDGSKSGHRTGWGVAAFSPDGKCQWERSGCIPGATIYDAEMRAVEVALTWCTDTNTKPAEARLFSDDIAVGEEPKEEAVASADCPSVAMAYFFDVSDIAPRRESRDIFLSRSTNFAASHGIGFFSQR
jgi:hypothetical protein